MSISRSAGKHASIYYLCMLVCLFIFTANVFAQRKMENLGRGGIAIRTATNSVLVNWRIPVPEYASNARYNLYRGTIQIATNLNVSNYVDVVSANETYYVAAVINNVEQAKSPAISVTTDIYGTNTIPAIKVPIKKTDGYSVGLIYVGDLDGDSEYDFVFTYHPADATQSILVQACKRDGTFLWQADCGKNSISKYNIEPGSSTVGVGHGDNMTVYDINCDGKAEVILRTAGGVKFGDGGTLTQSDTGKQFISVLEGTTGKELSTVAVPTDYLSDGPMNGHMGIAYLDGINPSVIWSSKNRIGSGDFNMMVTAYSWKNNALSLTWKYLRTDGTLPDGHNIRIIDVNADGKDEIIPFGFALKPDGTLMYSLYKTGGLCHGDRFMIGDLDPSRDGLEGYAIQQDNESFLAWAYYDAKTGTILQKQNLTAIADLARGNAGDFDPRTAGYEFWTFTDGIYNVSGSKVSAAIPSSYPNMRLWWTGDLLSQNLDNNKLLRWNYTTSAEERLYTFKSNIQWARNVPGFYGDILGDWREEVMYPSDDGSCLLIFSTPYSTTERIYTLPHNPGYRNCFNSKGYYQSNMADFYLGDGMSAPVVPNIICIGVSTPVTLNKTSSMQPGSSAFTTIANQKICLNGDPSLLSRIAIYDCSGKLVKTATAKNGATIDLQKEFCLPSKSYIVEQRMITR